MACVNVNHCIFVVSKTPIHSHCSKKNSQAEMESYLKLESQVCTNALETRQEKFSNIPPSGGFSLPDIVFIYTFFSLLNLDPMQLKLHQYKLTVELLFSPNEFRVTSIEVTRSL